MSRLKGDQRAIAETIENNIRSRILQEHLNDPAYYEKMSALLDEIIQKRREQATHYEDYLQQVAALAERVQQGQQQGDGLPQALDSDGKRVLYRNLLNRPRPGQPLTAAEAPLHPLAPEPEAKAAPGVDEEALAASLALDAAIKAARPDQWRGNAARERVVKAAMYQVLKDVAETERLFKIVVAQERDY
jgi:type I restriction enzyme R subunit